MSIRNKIISAFNSTEFFINERSAPLDDEIKDFIYEINKRKGIVTVISCAGHSKEEKQTTDDMNPYLAFRVNDIGWRVFWTLALPEISSELPVIVWIVNEKKLYTILLRAEGFLEKNQFWKAVRKSFLAHFVKS